MRCIADDEEYLKMLISKLFRVGGAWKCANLVTDTSDIARIVYRLA